MAGSIAFNPSNQTVRTYRLTSDGQSRRDVVQELTGLANGTTSTLDFIFQDSMTGANENSALKITEDFNGNIDITFGGTPSYTDENGDKQILASKTYVVQRDTQLEQRIEDLKTESENTDAAIRGELGTATTDLTSQIQTVDQRVAAHEASTTSALANKIDAVNGYLKGDTQVDKIYIQPHGGLFYSIFGGSAGPLNIISPNPDTVTGGILAGEASQPLTIASKGQIFIKNDQGQSGHIYTSLNPPTAAELGGTFEALGASKAAVTAHTREADPHTQYLNVERADARYIQIGQGGTGGSGSIVAGVSSVNGHKGDVTLTASDVGADDAGTAASLVQAHDTTADPHPTYLNTTRGDARYPAVATANQPGGYVKLDTAGHIPVSLLTTVNAAQYKIVPNQTARLALPQINNLYVVQQTDTQRTWYLESGADPSVASGWFDGGSYVAQGVSSFKGRTGTVTPAIGDYTADQVTPTANRNFVSTAQIAKWDAKQDALTSGVTIKTINGQSIMGAGDMQFSIDVSSLNVAPKVHTHTASQVTDLVPEVKKIVGPMIKSGTGIAAVYDQAAGTVTLTNTAGSSSGGGGANYIVINKIGSKADTGWVPPAVNSGLPNYVSIPTDHNTDFDLHAYAMKREVLANTDIGMSADNPTYMNPAMSANLWKTTGEVTFQPNVGTPDAQHAYIVSPTTKIDIQTVADGAFFSGALPGNSGRITQLGSAAKIQFTATGDNAASDTVKVKRITGGYTVDGNSAWGASAYQADQDAWKAFDGTVTSPIVAVNGDTSIWRAGWQGDDAGRTGMVSIELPEAKALQKFRFTKIASPTAPNGELGFTPAWVVILGSDNGTNWTVLSKGAAGTTWTQDAPITTAANRVYTMTLNTPKSYKYYGIQFANNHALNGVGPRGFAEIELFEASKMLLKDGDGTFYSVDAQGALTAITAPTDAASFDAAAFVSGATAAGALTGKTGWKVVTSTASRVEGVYAPSHQAVVTKQKVNAKFWRMPVMIKELNTATGSGTGANVKYLLSTDGATWKYWGGTPAGWQTVANADLTTSAGAKAAFTTAMDASTLATLGLTNYGALFGATDVNLDQMKGDLYIAILINEWNPAVSFVNYSSCGFTFTVANKASWRLLSNNGPDAVTIRWFEDEVRFYPTQAGDYKFAYQVKGVTNP